MSALKRTYGADSAWALAAAGVYAIALAVLALTLPISTTETEPSGTVTRHTLVDGDVQAGLAVLMPLVVFALVAAALARRTRGGRIVAGAITALVTLSTVVSLMSVGIVLVPLAIALIAACANAQAASRAP